MNGCLCPAVCSPFILVAGCCGLCCCGLCIWGCLRGVNFGGPSDFVSRGAATSRLSVKRDRENASKTTGTAAG
ncbi:hypothetical protein C8J57DRAFT_1333538 [Mycena rebaudengoi]|nr:hypothetical protein C8J57DRAFT_1333538 [Mycena rebaudengoi]